MNDTIMEVNGLVKEYTMHGGGLFRKASSFKAVSDISFSIRRGETFSLVGESGCGKSTLGRCLVRGIEATAGTIDYFLENGERVDFLRAGQQTYKNIRKQIQMIFQDPFSSLNPRMTVYDIISEPLKANFKLEKEQINERVVRIAEQTGLNVSYLRRYPHAFSGGQRQRIGIARALVTQPKLIVCDEALSALDVSIQAQIINLLKDLQEQYGITFVFISHDLSVVKHISTRIAVMYLGQIVEMADTAALFGRPSHPYTEALLSSVPKPDPDRKSERIILQGEVPNPAKPPSGCHFHPRCRYRTALCEQQAPEMKLLGDGHYAMCHYAGELDLKGHHEPKRSGTDG